MEFVEGLKYPWGKPVRLWNILWVLLPVIGWFALMGYIVDIVTAIAKGKKKELPEMGGLWDSFVLGLIITIKAIPLIVAFMILSTVLIRILGPLLGMLLYFVVIFTLGFYLFINLFVKRTLASSFDILKAWNAIIKNFGEYIVALVYTILFGIIYGVLMIVLVGIPCSMFGRYVYIADFYAKHSK